MIRRPPRSTLSSSSAASDVYKRQDNGLGLSTRVVPDAAAVTMHYTTPPPQIMKVYQAAPTTSHIPTCTDSFDAANGYYTFTLGDLPSESSARSLLRHALLYSTDGKYHDVGQDVRNPIKDILIDVNVTTGLWYAKAQKSGFIHSLTWAKLERAGWISQFLEKEMGVRPELVDKEAQMWQYNGCWDVESRCTSDGGMWTPVPKGKKSWGRKCMGLCDKWHVGYGKYCEIRAGPAHEPQ